VHHWSYDHIAQAFVDGNPVDGLTRDEVLGNVTFAWLTNTGISSARLYWENKLGFFDVKGVTVPAAVSVFPRELYQAPRSWAERAYPNPINFNAVDRAATSPPGKSRSSSQPRCGPPSGHCVDQPPHQQPDVVMDIETVIGGRPFHVDIRIRRLRLNPAVVVSDIEGFLGAIELARAARGAKQLHATEDAAAATDKSCWAGAWPYEAPRVPYLHRFY
jgi:hypothetical protein